MKDRAIWRRPADDSSAISELGHFFGTSILVVTIIVIVLALGDGIGRFIGG